MRSLILILISILSIGPSYGDSRTAGDLHLCKHKNFEFDFGAPVMAVGEVIFLKIRHMEERREAIGIIREIGKDGDMIADFPIDSNMKFDPTQAKTTVNYVASLKQGSLTVVQPNAAGIGETISGKCRTKKVTLQ